MMLQQYKLRKITLNFFLFENQEFAGRILSTSLIRSYLPEIAITFMSTEAGIKYIAWKTLILLKILITRNYPILQNFKKYLIFYKTTVFK